MELKEAKFIKKNKKFWILGVIAAAVLILLAPYWIVYLLIAFDKPLNPEKTFRDNRPYYETIVSKAQQHTLTDQDKDSEEHYEVDEQGGVVRVAFSLGGMIDNWCAIIYDPTDLVLEANRYKFDIDLENTTDTKLKSAVKLFGGDLVSVERLDGSWYKGCFS